MFLNRHRKSQNGFTPLEKTADFNRRLSSFKTDSGLKPPSTPLENLFLTGSASAVREPLNSLTGFTLVEVLVAAFILVVTLSGLLLSYVTCISLNEISRNTGRALHAAQARMETIKNSSDFDQIAATYNTVSITMTNPTGRIISYVNDSNPDLLLITVSVCWRQTNDRVIGEDADLDGQIDAGEDTPPLNNMLDSPVQLVTYLRRQS